MPNRYAPMGRTLLPGTASGTPPRPPKAAKVATVPKPMAPAKAARRNMSGNLGKFLHHRKAAR
jgi:hypothetical protein